MGRKEEGGIFLKQLSTAMKFNNCCYLMGRRQGVGKEGRGGEEGRCSEERDVVVGGWRSVITAVAVKVGKDIGGGGTTEGIRGGGRRGEWRGLSSRDVRFGLKRLESRKGVGQMMQGKAKTSGEIATQTGLVVS